MSQEEYIKQLETTIQSLENQVANLTELILGFKKSSLALRVKKQKEKILMGS